MLKSMPKKEEGVLGEDVLAIDLTGFKKICDFPDLNTPDRLFDNIPFKMLPIIHIRSHKNNTLFTLTDHEGQVKMIRSCGCDGFKNCRKKTSIAAQITATSFAKIISKMGYKTCRICIDGIGPGRMSSFKGLQLAGINIVSITDSTLIIDYPKQRPRAAKSL
ncbi:30S ribosomal protein S11-like protein [Sarcoptes scabiei]|nr:30S ribosomal protein S11-like protein [Sarcoptes scabiei]